MIQTQDLPIVPLPDNITTPKGFFESLRGLSIDDALSNIANGIVQFSFRLMLALVVFYIGKFIIKKLYNLVYTVMVNRRMDASLTTFALSLIRILLFFILIVTIIGILGIETSSFLALFASAGVAIGMALSGTLQNFAGGVLILLLKPYKVGDYIDAQGFNGTVKEIQIFHTVINTPDNKTIIIPNGGLSTGSINNYSKEDFRRVDWTVGLSYGNDYAQAQQVILDMLLAEEWVIKGDLGDEPDLKPDVPEGPVTIENYMTGHEKPKTWWQRLRAKRRLKQLRIQNHLRQQLSINEGLPMKKDGRPFVGLGALADSSINLTVRAWTRSAHYWPLFFKMNERFYTELPQHGFSFPFPQLDVHIADVPETLVKK